MELVHTYTEKVGRILETQSVFNGITATYAAFFAIVVGSTLNFPPQLKWECLDHQFILHCRQLQHLVQEYVAYYNQARPYQGIEQQIPDSYEQDYPLATVPIIATPVLNGLHHDYSRAVYLH